MHTINCWLVFFQVHQPNQGVQDARSGNSIHREDTDRKSLSRRLQRHRVAIDGSSGNQRSNFARAPGTRRNRRRDHGRCAAAGNAGLQCRAPVRDSGGIAGQHRGTECRSPVLFRAHEHFHGCETDHRRRHADSGGRRRRVDKPGPERAHEFFSAGRPDRAEARTCDLHGDDRHRRGGFKALQDLARGAGRVFVQESAADVCGAGSRPFQGRDHFDHGDQALRRQEDRRDDQAGGHARAR